MTGFSFSEKFLSPPVVGLQNFNNIFDMLHLPDEIMCMEHNDCGLCCVLKPPTKETDYENISMKLPDMVCKY